MSDVEHIERAVASIDEQLRAIEAEAERLRVRRDALCQFLDPTAAPLKPATATEPSEPAEVLDLVGATMGVNIIEVLRQVGRPMSANRISDHMKASGRDCKRMSVRRFTAGMRTHGVLGGHDNPDTYRREYLYVISDEFKKWMNSLPEDQWVARVQEATKYMAKEWRERAGLAEGSDHEQGTGGC